ncbi:MAG: hypothetical protein C4K60_06020 [Ideonella sp. MAG2]|nr:MAG: hypothetical protein C4K60_06020 [Ideonella sp. MAG2]
MSSQAPRRAGGVLATRLQDEGVYWLPQRVLNCISLRWGSSFSLPKGMVGRTPHATRSCKEREGVDAGTDGAHLSISLAGDRLTLF